MKTPLEPHRRPGTGVPGGAAAVPPRRARASAGAAAAGRMTGPYLRVKPPWPTRTIAQEA